MARNQSEVSSANANISLNLENCSTFLQAFLETHDEANKLDLSNNRLKGLKQLVGRKSHDRRLQWSDWFLAFYKLMQRIKET